MIDSMRENQREVLERLPDSFNALILDLMEPKSLSVLNRAACTLCRDAVLGSMMRAMAMSRGSISLTLSAKNDETIEELHQSIIDIVKQACPLAKHWRCNPRRAIEGSLEECIRKCKLNFFYRSEKRVEQMDKRRDYLGIESVEQPEEE